MAAIRTIRYILTGGDQPEILKGVNTSASFFSLLGATPALGRFYNDQDDKPGAARVAVLTNGFWQRRFGGDHNAVGRSMTLDNLSYTIIGVAPAGFGLVSREGDIFLPIGLNGDNPQWVDRGNHPGIRVIARLKRDATLGQAQADMDAICARLDQQYPVTNSGVGVIIDPLYETLVKDARPTLNLL